jgi:peptidoglycan-associated lipoprotein
MACTHTTKPAESARIAPLPVVATTSTVARVPKGVVAMSEDLRRLCAIEDTGTAPKFDFDATQLSATDRNELDQLAKCMTTGPLAGKNVTLVGRADPRGEEEYNMALGARRATAVEHYLAQSGVAESRLPVTTRGALDAQGHDEQGWAADRRVDLRLAGR